MSETRQILEKIKNGEMTIEEAESYFKSEPFKELGFAKLDHHRKVRNGFPEVVFCEGKADDYIVSIFEQLAKEDGCAFGTFTRRGDRQGHTYHHSCGIKGQRGVILCAERPVKSDLQDICKRKIIIDFVRYQFVFYSLI